MFQVAEGIKGVHILGVGEACLFIAANKKENGKL